MVDVWCYPANWPAISRRIRERDGQRCRWCGAGEALFDLDTGRTVLLTTMHLDGDPWNSENWNLVTACRPCHAAYDAPQRVVATADTLPTQLLSHDGTKQEVSGGAYILVPDITLTVDLSPQEHPSGAVGQVTSSDWRGMRHHEIAAVRGLYYGEDQALAIWEVDAFGRLESFAHGILWHQVESFLSSRFPLASRIYTDDSEPGEDSVQNRDFLSGLDYQPVVGTARILAKEVRRQ